MKISTKGDSLSSIRWTRVAMCMFGLALFALSVVGGSVVSAKQQPAPPASAPQAASSQPDANPDFPAGPGRDVTLRLCSKCHSPNNILAMGRTPEGWQDLIVKMTTMGLQGTDEEFTATLDYLTASFPPKINVNRANAAQLTSALALTPAEAAAIVSYRDKNGSYKTIDDLKKVSGVDGKKFDARKDLLQF
jgi:competence protein ComEA